MSGVVCFASLLVVAGTLVNGELLAELGSQGYDGFDTPIAQEGEGDCSHLLPLPR